MPFVSDPTITPDIPSQADLQQVSVVPPATAFVGDEFTPMTRADTQLAGTHRDLITPKNFVADDGPGTHFKSDDGASHFVADESASPSWGRVLSAGVYGIPSTIAHTAAPVWDAAAQALHGIFGSDKDNFDPDAAQKATESAFPTGKGMDTSGTIPQPSPNLLTPQEQASQTYGKSLTSAGLGMVANVLPAVAAGPAAPAVFAGMGAMQQGMGGIDQGESLRSAQIESVIGGATGYAQAYIPMRGATLARSFGLGVVTNPAAVMVNDVATKLIMGQYGDEKAKSIAANIDPFDLTKLSQTAILGGIMGPAFHKAQDLYTSAGDKAKADALTAILKDGTYMQDFVSTMSKTTEDLLPNRAKMVPNDGETHSQAVERLLSTDSSADHARLSDIIDLHAENSSLDPQTREAYQVLQRRISALGLDDTTVTRMLGDKPTNAKSMGQYDPEQDAVTMFKGDLDPTHILHETIHAVTSNAIELHDGMSAADRAKLPPDQQTLMNHIDGLNDIYRAAIERSPDKAKILENHQVEAEGGKGEWTAETYGYKNLKEFTAEVFSREKFQRSLQEMKITPEESRVMRVQTPRTIKTLWNAFTAKLHGIISGQDSNTLARNPTMLQMAVDHATNLVEKVGADTRTIFADPDRWNNSHHEDLLNGKMDKAREAFADKNQKGVFYQISNLLKNANSKAEFLTRLAVMDTHPAWRDYVRNYGEKLWDNGDHVINTVGKDTAYDNMTGSEHLMAGNEEQIPDFFERIKKQLPEEAKGSVQEKEDIPAAGTAFLPAQQNLWLKGSSIGGQIMKMFINHASMYHALGLKIRAEATHYFVEYQKLSKSDQRKFMDVAAHFDNVSQGGAELIKKGLQWPTSDMLTKEGMNPAHVHAYGEMTKGLDYLWNIENQLAMKNGQPPIPQIPGYMPHIWSGDFKVKVLRTETYSGNHPKSGTAESKVVEVRAFNTRWGALNFVESIKKRGEENYGVPGSKNIGDPNTKVNYSPDVNKKSGKPYEISSLGEVSTSMMRSIQEHVTAAHNLNNDPDVVSKLEEIEAARYQGFTKHMLERSDISGYLGEMGTHKPSDAGINPIRQWINAKENNKIVNLYDNYAKNVSEAYKNALFMAEVGRPVLDHMPMKLENGTYYGSVLDNIENTKNYLKEFTSNFSGKNINHLKWADDEVRWEPVVLFGLSPNLLRQTIGNLKNFMSILYLRANPVFYFSNVIQPLHTATMLQMASSIHTLGGGEAPSMMKTFSEFFKELPEPSPEMRAALDWAKNNHILDAQLEYAMRRENLGNFKDFKSMFHTMTGGTINPMVERFGRQMSFMLAYKHFQQMYPGDVMRARTASQQVMELTMVNYDKSSKPLMFTNFGALGELASPFATFHNAYIGNTFMAMKLAALNPQHKAAFLPLAYSLGIFGATAGIVGMPLVQDFNSLLDTANDIFGTNMPTVEKMLFQSHIPDSATFGLLNAGSKYIPGNSEGVNIAPSVSAVQMDQGLMTAMLPFVTALASIGKLTVKGLGNTIAPQWVSPNSAEDFWKVANALLPGVAKIYLQSGIPSLGIPGFTQRDVPIIPKGVSLEGGVAQTPANEFSQTYFGRTSSDTNKAKVIDMNASRQSKYEQDQIKSAVALVADNIMGLIGSSNDKAEWARRKSAELQVPGDEFNKMVSDEIVARNIPQARADLLATTPAAQRRVKERRDEGYPERGQ